MLRTAPTTVVNVTEVNRHDDDVVRIDAGSDWACPYRVGEDGTRPQVVAKFAAYVRTRPDLLDRLDELRGRRLACWCPPLPCHGDVLVDLVERADPAGELDVEVLVERPHGCAGDECRVPGCDRSGSPVVRPSWSTAGDSAPTPAVVSTPCPHEGCANPATTSQQRPGGEWWRVCEDHSRRPMATGRRRRTPAPVIDVDLDREGTCPADGCAEPSTTNRQRPNGCWWRLCDDHADDGPPTGDPSGNLDDGRETE